MATVSQNKPRDDLTKKLLHDAYQEDVDFIKQYFPTHSAYMNTNDCTTPFSVTAFGGHVHIDLTSELESMDAVDNTDDLFAFYDKYSQPGALPENAQKMYERIQGFSNVDLNDYLGFNSHQEIKEHYEQAVAMVVSDSNDLSELGVVADSVEYSILGTVKPKALKLSKYRQGKVKTVFLPWIDRSTRLARYKGSTIYALYLPVHAMEERHSYSPANHTFFTRGRCWAHKGDPQIPPEFTTKQHMIQSGPLKGWVMYVITTDNAVLPPVVTGVEPKLTLSPLDANDLPYLSYERTNLHAPPKLPFKSIFVDNGKVQRSKGTIPEIEGQPFTGWIVLDAEGHFLATTFAPHITWEKMANHLTHASHPILKLPYVPLDAPNWLAINHQNSSYMRRLLVKRPLVKGELSVPQHQYASTHHHTKAEFVKNSYLTDELIKQSFAEAGQGDYYAALSTVMNSSAVITLKERANYIEQFLNTGHTPTVKRTAEYHHEARYITYDGDAYVYDANSPPPDSPRSVEEVHEAMEVASTLIGDTLDD